MTLLLPVPGFHKYAVTRDGLLWNLVHKKVIKPDPSSKYIRYQLRTEDKNGRTHLLAHRIVFAAFVLGYFPSKLELVLHKDGNRYNNDYTNLYLGNHYQNSRDTTLHGHRYQSSKISEEDVLKIMVDPRGRKAVAKEYGCSAGYVENLRQGVKQRHLTHFAQCPVPYLNQDIINIVPRRKKIQGSQIFLDYPSND